MPAAPHGHNPGHNRQHATGGDATEPDGSLLTADNYRDRMLRRADGQLTVSAGADQPGFAGDGGPAVEVQLDDVGSRPSPQTGTSTSSTATGPGPSRLPARFRRWPGTARPVPPATEGLSSDASLTPSDVAVSPQGVGLHRRWELCARSRPEAGPPRCFSG
jgi:hypothetical protein